ncbi:hypothetical protein [uncultured Gemella sp.]|uniref:hypothetical protein n=1 Tax=uncultured Gemella sp. TaxID=254352 RepID=UPI0028E7BFE1|nr:hypothetical protein [uncultured Gemella sp.]
MIFTIILFSLLAVYVYLIFIKHEKNLAEEQFLYTLASKTFSDKDMDDFTEKYPAISKYIKPIYEAGEINIKNVSLEKSSKHDNSGLEANKIIYSGNNKDLLILLWYIKLTLYIEAYNKPMIMLSIRIVSNFKKYDSDNRFDENKVAKEKAEKNQFGDICLA